MPETLLDELLDRAFLFDEPGTYRAGVLDAWSAMRSAMRAASGSAASSSAAPAGREDTAVA